LFLKNLGINDDIYGVRRRPTTTAGCIEKRSVTQSEPF
jgi:hypothetical protein